MGDLPETDVAREWLEAMMLIRRFEERAGEMYAKAETSAKACSRTSWSQISRTLRAKLYATAKEHGAEFPVELPIDVVYVTPEQPHQRALYENIKVEIGIDLGKKLAKGIDVCYVTRFQKEREALLARNTPVGIKLQSSENPEVLGADVHHFSLIALEFPKFRDGRAFARAAPDALLSQRSSSRSTPR